MYIHIHIYIYIYIHISPEPHTWSQVEGMRRSTAVVQLGAVPPTPHTFFFFFITLGLELSDTKVYEP